MRKQITLEPLPPAIVDPRKPIELNSFKIAFRHRNPKTAAEVANRLARDFISANLRDRTSLAEGTNEFFEQQLTKARADLADIARQVSDYKENYQGELPEQLAAEPRAARAQPDRARRDRVEGRGRARPGAPDHAADPGAAHRVGHRPDRPDRAQAHARARAEPAALRRARPRSTPTWSSCAPRSPRSTRSPRTAPTSRWPTSRDEITMRDKLRDYEVDAERALRRRRAAQGRHRRVRAADREHAAPRGRARPPRGAVQEHHRVDPHPAAEAGRRRDRAPDRDHQQGRALPGGGVGGDPDLADQPEPPGVVRRGHAARDDAGPGARWSCAR